MRAESAESLQSSPAFSRMRLRTGERGESHPLSTEVRAVNLFYEILADLLFAVHFGYVSFVVLGQLAILIGWALRWLWIRNPWFRISHLVMILIVAFEAAIDYQ